MKIVRLKNNLVVEIIPEYALPVEKWYNASFAAKCLAAPDYVEQNWTYDPTMEKWIEPVDPEPAPEPDPDPEPTATTDERLTALEAENKLLKEQVAAQADQAEFYEDCIAEMAAVVYA